jgi:hypothetical protein
MSVAKNFIPSASRVRMIDLRGETNPLPAAIVKLEFDCE